ncbi:MAG: glycosyltransferase family 39 protein, partial [Candidatus Krumholzibacteria bacterium]|nr:glycosyltransferase family 39 protein [Candidatus Krumholzibacteria bacterium]
MPFRNILLLILFLGLSYLFFCLAIDNGFWHGEDFLSLEHSLLMKEGAISAFDSSPPFKFQPLVYGLYYLLFTRFLFDARGYFIFNIILHGFNSFLVFLLVNTLLKDRTVALLSGLLFVFTVGSYGKSVMIVSGLEDIVITFLTLLTMLFYFKNEIDAGGKLISRWFFLALLFFVASMLTRSTSFSILGAFLAFNLLYRADTSKRPLSADFLVLLAIAIAALIIKTRGFHYAPNLYTKDPGP